MWIRVLASVGLYQIALMGLWQSQVFSDSMVRVLEDFPVVGLVIFTLYYVSKMQRADNEQQREYLERTLEAQRQNLREIYDSQQAFVAALLTQLETKQNRMSDRIELLTQQLAINTSTVSEIAKVDTIVGDLIARLEKK